MGAIPSMVATVIASTSEKTSISPDKVQTVLTWFGILFFMLWAFYFCIIFSCIFRLAKRKKRGK